MANILAIANQKGGVGKTTTCVNLCAALAACDRTVLLIDCDPQGNATMGSGIDKHTLTHTCNDVLLGKIEISSTLIGTKGGYELLPGNGDLTEAEVALLQQPRRELKLLQALAKIRDRFEYILIDCPPSLNTLTLNALVAAQAVLVPLQCEYYALEGLSALVNTITQLQASVNRQLQLGGIVRTMFDGRNRLSNEVSQHLIEHFGRKVYETIIPRNVRLAEAPSYGLPGILYDKTSAGAQAYIALAKEIMTARDEEFIPKPTTTYVRQSNES